MTANWNIAMTALQKGGLKRDAAEELLVCVVDEMIAASDECVGTAPVSITNHEFELFMWIIKGLVAGGMGDGAAILLVAMYATTVQERVEHKIMASNRI